MRELQKTSKKYCHVKIYFLIDLLFTIIIIPFKNSVFSSTC